MRKPALAIVLVLVAVAGVWWLRGDVQSANQVLKLPDSTAPGEADRSTLAAPHAPSSERSATGSSTATEPRATVGVLRDDLVDPALSPAAIELHVIVSERVTGLPVVGAQVLRQRKELAVTDADGRAVCDWQIADGNELFEVVAHGFGKVIARVDVDFAGPEHPVMLELAQSATLSGRVKGLSGAGPFVARVTADGNHLMKFGRGWEPSVRETSWAARFDSLGRFEVFDLPPDVPLTVTLREHGAEPRLLQVEPIVLEAGEVREIEWDLAVASSITGRVTDSQGRGIEGLLMQMQLGTHPGAFRAEFGEAAGESVTNSRGEFRFEQLAAGHYLIGRAKSRDAQDTQELCVRTQALDLQAGESIAGLQLIAYAGNYIEGRVLSVAGAGRARVHVIAREHSSSWYSAFSGEDGAFAIGPLVPGEYEVTAHLANDLDAAPPPIRVTAPVESVVIQLITAGSIAGRIVDPGSGAALPGMVALQPAVGAGTRLADAKGAAGFRFGSLAAGEYALIAIAEDGRVGRIEHVVLKSGAALEDLEVQLEPSGELRVHFTARTGVNLHARIGAINLLDVSASNATIAHFQAPAGPVTLELVKHSPNLDPSLAEVLVTRVVQVLAGETIDVVLEE
jgi:hypothetical protein